IYNTNNNAQESNLSPVLAPAPLESSIVSPVPAPAPEPASPNTENAFGLYGHGSSQFSPAKTTTIANDENEFPSEELSEESFKESNKEDSYNYNNNNNNNENVYTTSNYNSNGYSTSKDNYNGYNNNGYVAEPQGISDTRFYQSGRYYYDVKSENNYQNGYETVTGRSNNGGYYGDGKNSKYEFDSMEEYERQEGYP
ncbi:unnamed protein product, partial [Ilex paraguariensis]